MTVDHDAFMDYVAWVTPETIERVLRKYHVQEFVDAEELAQIIKDDPDQGIYDAYYFLIGCGLEPRRASLITGDIHRLHVGKWVDGEWQPDVLEPRAIEKGIR